MRLCEFTPALTRGGLCTKMGRDGAPAPLAPRSAAQRDIFPRRICPIFRPLNAGGDAAGAASLPKNSIFCAKPPGGEGEIESRFRKFLRRRTLSNRMDCHTVKTVFAAILCHYIPKYRLIQRCGKIW